VRISDANFNRGYGIMSDKNRDDRQSTRRARVAFWGSGAGKVKPAIRMHCGSGLRADKIRRCADCAIARAHGAGR
jgi:hypothetical protein